MAELNTQKWGPALVVGRGSIGLRHARCLSELGVKVGIVASAPPALEVPHFSSLANALAQTKDTALVVIANETSRHAQSLAELQRLRFTGTVLVEKPLTDVPNPVATYGFNLLVAYCLRSHPGVRALAKILAHEPVYSIQMYVGGYLPSWRPGRDYRDTYSAKIALGGGVLNDLSHELDLLELFTGPWKRVVASIGKRSPLEIETEDCASLLIESERCSQCSLEMNYLHRPKSYRRITVNCGVGTVELDFGSQKLTVNGDDVAVLPLPDSIYHEQLRMALSGRGAELCNEATAVRIVELIAAARRSTGEQRWIAREI